MVKTPNFFRQTANTLIRLRGEPDDVYFRRANLSEDFFSQVASDVSVTKYNSSGENANVSDSIAN